MFYWYPAVNLHNNNDCRRTWMLLCGFYVKMKNSPAVSCISISGGCIQAFWCGSPVTGQTTEALSALCLLSWLCGRSNNRELQPHYLWKAHVRRWATLWDLLNHLITHWSMYMCILRKHNTEHWMKYSFGNTVWEYVSFNIRKRFVWQ